VLHAVQVKLALEEGHVGLNVVVELDNVNRKALFGGQFLDVIEDFSVRTRRNADLEGFFGFLIRGLLVTAAAADGNSCRRSRDAIIKDFFFIFQPPKVCSYLIS
jgi:hypothetical protein